MNFSHADGMLRYSLRGGAVVSIVALAAADFNGFQALGFNQYLNNYALWFVAAATAFVVLINHRSLSQLFGNLDFAVPSALYLGLNTVLSYYVNNLRVTESGLSQQLNAFAIYLLPFVINSILTATFVGWTVRMMLDFVRKGTYGLTDSLHEISDWLPKSVVVVAVHWVAFGIYIGAAYFLYAIFLTSAANVVVIGFFGIVSLIFNMALIGLLPYLILHRGRLAATVRDGIRFSLGGSRAVLGFIFSYLIVAGWIFFATFVVDIGPPTAAEFGYTRPGPRPQIINHVASEPVELALMPTKSLTQQRLTALARTTQVPTVSLRISLLLILAGLCTHLTIIRRFFGDSSILMLPRPAEVPLKLTFAGFAIIFLSVPFESYLSSTPVANNGVFPDYKLAAVLTGDGLFDVKTLVESREDGVFTGDSGRLLGEDWNWQSLAYEPATDSIVLGRRFGAVRVDRQGRKAGDVFFDLDKVRLGKGLAGIEKLSITDLDGDGKVEYLGLRGDPKAAVLFDSDGRFKLRVTAPEGDVDDVAGFAGADAGAARIVIRGKDQWLSADLDGKSVGKLNGSPNSTQDLFVADAEHDGEPDVLRSDWSGLAIGNMKKGSFGNGIAPITFVGVLGQKNPQSIFMDDNRIGFFDLDGTRRLVCEAPFSSYREITNSKRSNITVEPYRAVAVRVRFANGSDAHIAVAAYLLQKTDALHASQMLYVYDPKGELVYQELVPDTPQSALIAVPNGDGTESMVWMTDKAVRSYSLKTN